MSAESEEIPYAAVDVQALTTLQGKSTKNNTANTVASKSVATTARAALICTALLLAGFWGPFISLIRLSRPQYWLRSSAEM